MNCTLFIPFLMLTFSCNRPSSQTSNTVPVEAFSVEAYEQLEGCDKLAYVVRNRTLSIYDSQIMIDFEKITGVSPENESAGMSGIEFSSPDGFIHDIKLWGEAMGCDLNFLDTLFNEANRVRVRRDFQ